MGIQIRTEKLKTIMRYFFPRETDAADSVPLIDPESVIADLRLFLVQLAQWISDHREYEHSVGQDLPEDSGLIFRFRLEDYVTELCEFFEKKQLLLPQTSEQVLVLAAIEVLLPPENVRETLPWSIRRLLFVGLLMRIADRTGTPYASLTRTFYNHLARQSPVNGLSGKVVLDSYQEAILDLSRARQNAGDDREDAGTTPSAPEREPEPELTPEAGPAPEENPLEVSEVIRTTLAACGATDYTRLKRILSRKHVLEFFSVTLTYTIVAIAMIVFERPVVSFLERNLPVSIDTVTWYTFVVVIYALSVTIQFQRFRLRVNRRRTLIRVSNAIAGTLAISYKELDDVLYKTYGTTLRELKSALLPRSRK